MDKHIKDLCLPCKEVYYLDYYQVIVPSSWWKPYERITQKEMYQAILSAFEKSPTLFENCLSLETLDFLLGFLKNKDQRYSLLDNLYSYRDDFQFLDGLGIFDFKGTLNPDFLPLVERLAKEDSSELRNRLKYLTIVKGYLDLYGMIELDELAKVFALQGDASIKAKDIKILLNTPLIAHFYIIEGKKVLRISISEDDLPGFLKARRAYDDLPYAPYSFEEAFAYANDFVPLNHPLAKQIREEQKKFHDYLHDFSAYPNPFGVLLKEASDEEYGEYASINSSIPKWVLKGHTFAQLQIEKDKTDKALSAVDEKTFGPELFFLYKGTIHSFYAIIAKKLALKANLENDTLSAQDYEKILADMHAHFDEDVDLYRASLKDGITATAHEILKGLRESYFGHFIISDITERGLLLIDFETEHSFLVRPLGTPWHDMLRSSLKQSLVEMNIMPFRDFLAYDTFVCPSSMYIDMRNLKTKEDVALETPRLIATPEQFAALKA